MFLYCFILNKVKQFWSFLCLLFLIILSNWHQLQLGPTGTNCNWDSTGTSHKWELFHKPVWTGTQLVPVRNLRLAPWTISLHAKWKHPHSNGASFLVSVAGANPRNLERDNEKRSLKDHVYLWAANKQTSAQGRHTMYWGEKVGWGKSAQVHLWLSYNGGKVSSSPPSPFPLSSNAWITRLLGI